MGECPKNRKRKLKGDTEAVKSKDTAIIESINQNEATILKPKKAKKNKSTDIHVENDNDISESKPKKAKEAHITKEAVSETETTKPKKKKTKKNKVSVSADELNQHGGIVAKKQKKKKKKVVEIPNTSDELSEEIIAQYPVLKDEELIQRFKAVKVNNNQKGRIRHHFKDKVSGTSEAMQPELINNLIQGILQNENPDMKKIRILHNMLKQTLLGKTFEKPIKIVKKNDKEKNETEEKKQEQKVKGPKRYVVFIGNLPLDISKEKILQHFSNMSSNIKDVRIPKQGENKKSAIAYLEVADEVSYELALSKHHSMLDNRRINVLYSTQQNSKISKTEAKGKAAKLVALQKSGQLAGSVPLSKKRSARRKKMKLAEKQAREAAERGA